MTIEPTIAEMRDAPWINLNREPASEPAQRLAEVVAGIIEPHLAPTRSRGAPARSIGPGKRLQIKQDTGFILAGLLSGSWVVSAQRGKGGRMWNNLSIGYDRFWSRVDAMVSAGLVGIHGGTKGLELFGTHRGHPTRLWASAKLLKIAEEHGANQIDYDEHWHLSKAAQTRPRPVRDAALVHVAHIDGWASPLPAETHTETLEAMREHLKRLNANVAGATIAGCVFPAFQRSFGGDLRLGGRIYATGGGDTCQNIKRRHRSDIRINCEPVAEVDVKASQLSIFLRLTGGHAVGSADPYALPGVPREVVKAYCVQSFGSGRLISRWGHNTDPSVRLTKPRAARDALLAAYPAMADMTVILPPDLRDNPPPDEKPGDGIRWAAGQHLAYLESTAIAAALDYAMARGVVALPLHDALIVPESDVAVAEAALRGAYFIRLGFQPVVSVKRLGSSRSRL